MFVVVAMDVDLEGLRKGLEIVAKALPVMALPVEGTNQAEVTLSGGEKPGAKLVAQTCNGPVEFVVPEGASMGDKIRITMPASATMVALAAAPQPVTMGVGNDVGDLALAPYHLKFGTLGDGACQKCSSSDPTRWHAPYPMALEGKLSRQEWDQFIVELNVYSAANMDVNCCWCPCTCLFSCCPPLCGRISGPGWFVKMFRFLDEKNKFLAKKGVMCQIGGDDPQKSGMDNFYLFVLFMSSSQPSSPDDIAIFAGKPHAFEQASMLLVGVTEGKKLTKSLAIEVAKEGVKKAWGGDGEDGGE